ncbi:putative 64 kDa mitochondrial NADH dehydrogenase [Dioszegia hungarica]|uniref:64 kDa mitochondrial NADH dehydrogenase n=1 Tax=Dioszegia hungarica TaxID=4972 RepID=A0AA38HAX4_9TREE|nr:putative 64 kDa mitochondrial NADH dehydrogenase [Dioszegia hungarica]KAI9637628.1 putative 64 kDa mitochondrial NADH dehydrogenase [Dioszegia hungarica]
MIRPTSSTLATFRQPLASRALLRSRLVHTKPSTPTPSSQPKSLPSVQKRTYISFPSHRFSSKYPILSLIARLGASVVIGSGLLLGTIFVHDAFTYRERHVERVPVNALAISPRKGGKKDLPILEVDLDEEDEAKVKMHKKPRLVILGGGWGAVAVIQSLPVDTYNVTVISPQTYFTFTPLLPSACVGTVESRSLVEPLRKIVARVRGHFLLGSAVDIDMGERLLEVEVPHDQGEGTTRCYVPYDKLVIAVGSTSNDHGVPGLEHCFQLKTVPDAQGIRRRVMTNLELASLPTTTPEERKRLLSFVVCGGGPTGVEFAAELVDMMAEEVLSYFPKILNNDIRVHVIQSRDHILNTYSEKISEYAEARFARNDVNLVTNARVKEVTADKVVITRKDPKDKDAKPITEEISAGFVLWSTGIAMNPFTKRLVEILPNQFHSKAVITDSFLRVQGAPKGTVYAIGDAATISTDLTGDLLELWDKFDTNKDAKLDYAEWEAMAKFIKKRHPMAQQAIDKVRNLFDEYDTDKDEELRLNEVAEMFQKLEKKITSYPATAQVAAQQGKYLGAMFGKLAKSHKALELNEMPDMDDEAYYSPFAYRHLGNLAYIGNSAAFDYNGYSFAGGLLAMYAWRSIYWSEQTSMRTRTLLMFDWIKRGIFGRDLSKKKGTVLTADLT